MSYGIRFSSAFRNCGYYCGNVIDHSVLTFDSNGSNARFVYGSGYVFAVYFNARDFIAFFRRNGYGCDFAVLKSGLIGSHSCFGSRFDNDSAIVYRIRNGEFGNNDAAGYVS